jgi:hypothetical protein
MRRADSRLACPMQLEDQNHEGKCSAKVGKRNKNVRAASRKDDNQRSFYLVIHRQPFL